MEEPSFVHYYLALAPPFKGSSQSLVSQRSDAGPYAQRTTVDAPKHAFVSPSFVLYFCTLNGISYSTGDADGPEDELPKSKKKRATKKKKRISVEVIKNPEIPKTEGHIRVACISDTHNRHRELNLPSDVDVLLHAGDFTNKGTWEEMELFALWMKQLPFKYKIVVAGNHDLSLDKEFYEENWKTWHSYHTSPSEVISLLSSCCTYVRHQLIDVEGLKMFVSPYQPRQPKSRDPMAFGRARGMELKDKWKDIPEEIDILLTHTPPFGIRDIGIGDKNAGDEELLKVIKKVKPAVHVFGHIHQQYGVTEDKNTIFINAACKSPVSPQLNAPILFDVKFL